jgi:TrkA domain protein
MAQVQETRLPGVGIRHEFATRGGDNLGVITHRSGQRDLLLFDRADPDACGKVVRLDEEDARTLTELLGASQVAERQEAVRQSVSGLTIDWLPITQSWSCAGCRVRDTGLREQTGIVVVAVVRDGQTLPAPDDDFALRPGDMAVVVGSPEGIEKATDLLQRGAPAHK